VIDVGPLGPLSEDDLGRLRDRWRAEHARGVPVFVAEQAEPVGWAGVPSTAATAQWAAAAAGLTTPNEARALAGDPGRAQLGGLITAVNGLQNSLQAAGFAEAGNLAAAAERLAPPGDCLPPRVARWRPAVPVAVLLAVVLFAPVWLAVPVGCAAVLALCAYATARRHAARPARPAAPLIPAAASHATRYAAARTRYLATGNPADLAAMLAHVEVTPDDGGPEWTAQ